MCIRDRYTGNECNGDRIYSHLPVAGEHRIRMEQYIQRRSLFRCNDQFTYSYQPDIYDEWLSIPCNCNRRLWGTGYKQCGINSCQGQPCNHSTTGSAGSSLSGYRYTGNECNGDRIYSHLPVAGEHRIRMEQYIQRRSLFRCNDQFTYSYQPDIYDEWLSIPCNCNRRLWGTGYKQCGINSCQGQPCNHSTTGSAGSSLSGYRYTGNECNGDRIYSHLPVAGEHRIRMEQYIQRRSLFRCNDQFTYSYQPDIYDEWLSIPCNCNRRLWGTGYKQCGINSCQGQPCNHSTTGSAGSSLSGNRYTCNECNGDRIYSHLPVAGEHRIRMEQYI